MTRPPPRAQEVAPQGLRLRLWDHGGTGPVVLFLHGYLDTARSFDDVIAQIPRSIRCLALDWRGHGQSAAIPAGASAHLLDHAKDLAGVLRALGERGDAPQLLVAHSMGGNISLLLAGSAPSLCPPGLLLLDAIGAPAEAPEQQPERLGRVFLGLEQKRPFKPVADLAAAIARLRATNPGLSERGAERMARHALVPNGNAEAGLRFAFDPKLKGPTPVRWPEPMWRALCAAIPARVRVIRAEHGYVPPGEPATGRVAAMRAGTIETLPGATHHLHVERPEAVAALVQEELRQLEPATSG